MTLTRLWPVGEASEQPYDVAALGPVTVRSAQGTAVEPGGATAKALVVALALAGGPVSVRSLVDDVWQDDPPRNEKAALQTLISRVRSVAGHGLIASTPGGYALTDASRTDIAAARLALTEARAASARGDMSETEARASAGLGLWRGEPGLDLGETELAERWASTAERVRRELTLVRARGRLEAGDAAEALADLAPLADAAPFDDDVELLRLRALKANGRINDAVREFGEFRVRLRDELGTDPSPELVEFHAALLRGPEQAAETARVLRVGIRTPPNELLGRDADIAAVESLMASARLTTLLGAGGLGKTRLAQALAARAAERMPGVVVVELAGVRSGEDVPLALASTLGIREYSGTRLPLSDPVARVDVRERILDVLGERPTLLVMDNCEHLIDAAAEWIADILASRPNVRVLATSRAPLMIAAEQVYQLQPLPATTMESQPGPAVRLFMERARAARPSVVLPVETIESLCDKLDGLPLAIELAAARVRSMSVEEIERRIDNRFALLRGGDRAAPERHRTLLAVIDWSWNLLTASEQRTLSRLSLFADGFAADAAYAVCGDDGGDGRADVDADLEGLVNQSLLTAAESTLTGRVRYRMLETVREFGEQRLRQAGLHEAVGAGIRAWADSVAEAALGSTYGPQQIETFHRVEEEQDNLLASLRDAIAAGDSDTTCSVYAALGMHWTVRGAHSEVLSFAPQVMQTLRRYDPDEKHRDAAMVALALIGSTAMIGDMRSGLRAIVRVRRLHARGPASSPQLEAMLSLLLVMPDMVAGAAVVERMRASDDPAIASFAFLISAQLAENGGRLDDGVSDATQAFAHAQAAQDAWTIGMAAQTLAQLHSELGAAAEAISWADRALPQLELLHAGEDLRQVEWLRAINLVSLGELEPAREIFQELAALQPDSGNFDWNDLKAIGISGLAEVARAGGDAAEAERLYARGEQTWGDPPAGFAPWYYNVAAGLLATMVHNSHADDPKAKLVARRIRRRVLRDARARAGMIDFPVTGAAGVGIGVWLLAPEREGASTAEIDAGLELLTLGRGMHARRDFPSLDPERIVAEVRNGHPELDVDDAIARVDALTLRERAARFHEVVRSLRSLFA